MQKFLWLFLITPALLFSGEVERFDAGQGEWEKYSMAQLVYHADKGNPGGCMEFSGNMNIGIASRAPRFTGDYAAKGYDEIVLDLYISMQQLTAFTPEVFIRKSPSVAGWARPLENYTVQAGVWRTFATPFDPAWSDAQAIAAGWKRDIGAAVSFADTAKAVWKMGIRMKYPQVSAAFMRIDNIVLRKKPAPIQERLRGNTKSVDRQVAPIKPAVPLR